MGLDTSHDCWHGSYSTFDEWRKAVAKVVNIDLDVMEGFGGQTPWASLPPDPIHALLNHSDCEGEIAVADCLPLAVRLEEIAPLLGSNGGTRGNGARRCSSPRACGSRPSVGKWSSFIRNRPFFKN